MGNDILLLLWSFFYILYLCDCIWFIHSKGSLIFLQHPYTETTPIASQFNIWCSYIPWTLAFNQHLAKHEIDVHLLSQNQSLLLLFSRAIKDRFVPIRLFIMKFCTRLYKGVKQTSVEFNGNRAALNTNLMTSMLHETFYQDLRGRRMYLGMYKKLHHRDNVGCNYLCMP